MKLVLGILLLVMSIFLVVAVLMQNGKSKRLSGSIAGGAETFFGKAKSRTIDAVLSKVTTVVAILFVLVVIVVYVAFGSEAPELDPGAIQITPEQLQQMIENGEISIADENTENTEAPENTETPTEENTETPEAPVEENAETPAETPVEENAETPAE